MTAPTVADRAGLLGTCSCPLCQSPDAEVIQGKRTPHIVCEDCGTLIQTRTRRGGKLIAALLNPKHRVAPLPDPAPPPTPKPAPAPSKPRASFLGIPVDD